MNKKLIITYLLTIIMCISIASAINGNWTEQTNATAQDWSGIASSSDGTKLIAVTYGEYAWTSTDSGTTWTEHNNQGFWSSVASSGDGTKIIMGNSGGNDFLISNDSGLNWHDQEGGMSYDWYDVDISTDGTKMVAFANEDNIFISNNSGTTWSNTGQASGSQGAMSGDGLTIGTIFYGGDIFISNDSGITWTDHNELGSQNWVGIDISENGSRIAVANNQGYIYISDDYGSTWTNYSYTNRPYDCPDLSNQMGCEANAGCVWLCDNFPSCTHHSCQGSMYYLNGLAMSKDGSTIGVWQAIGDIFISNDSGTTWDDQISAGSRDWSGIAFSDNGSKIAVTQFNDTGGYIWTFGENSITCIENWTCNSYDNCNIYNISSCINVTDNNFCGNPFTGNLTDYDLPCIYDPCQVNFTRTELEPCQLNDTIRVTYVSSNETCNASINTTEACNYCDANIIMNTTLCDANSTQNITYTDLNLSTCCYMTSLINDCPTLYTPYNETYTQSCTYYIQDFNCTTDTTPVLNDKMNVVCIMPDNNTYACVVNTYQGTNLLATSPEYKEATSSIFTLSGQQETRTSFTPVQQLLNGYYTQKELRPDNIYTIEVLCTNANNTILRYQTAINPVYHSVDWLPYRIKWFGTSPLTIIFSILVILAILLGVIWLIKKARGR